MQAYVFTLFLAFSYVQNTPGMFAAFGFHFTDPAVAPMPVFVGLMLFSQTFWTPVDKVVSILLVNLSFTRCIALVVLHWLSRSHDGGTPPYPNSILSFLSS